MGERDLRPSRLEVTRRLIQVFIKEYFDQNPISQLGIIVTRNKMAMKLTELSGTPSQHMDKLKEQITTEDVPSFQNSLEMARQSLLHVPSYASREILIITASLTTADPGDILSTISTLAKEQIRVSVVSLSAELRVCRTMAEQTGGEFHVAKNEDHLKNLIMVHVTPPPSLTEKFDASMVRMGFPKQIVEPFASPCVCHNRMTTRGFICPRCGGKNCELPTECPICNTTLILSSHLARTYHHLFPLIPYLPLASTDLRTKCTGCTKSNPKPSTYCPRCDSAFCSVCDTFAHDMLHACPGCEGSVTE